MWTCSTCETNNQDTDAYCACCGMKRADIPKPTPTPKPNPQPAPGLQPTPASKPKTSWKKIIAAAIVLIICSTIRVAMRESARNTSTQRLSPSYTATTPTSRPTATPVTTSTPRPTSTPSNSVSGTQRASDAVSLSFNGDDYNAGLWSVPIMVPDKSIQNCKSFTLCFQYNQIDSSLLGDQRVYVGINLKGNAWLETSKLNVPKTGVVYRLNVKLDKARNVEGIGVLPANVSGRSYQYNITAWIENIK